MKFTRNVVGTTTSLADELRKYAQGWRETPNLMDDLDAGDIDGLLGDLEHIADLIDAEHDRALMEMRSQAYNDGYDEGFASADDWLAEHEDAMAEHGWIRLLVDADGVPIRIGDKVDSDHHEDGTVVGIEYIETPNGVRHSIAVRPDGWDVATWYAPDGYRHHHAPTVEDVLREFAQEMNENLGMYTGEAIDADEWRDADAKTVEKYAARLRLRENA